MGVIPKSWRRGRIAPDLVIVSIVLAVAAASVLATLLADRNAKIPDLPDTQEGIHQALIFDYHKPTEDGTKTGEKGYDYVWGAQPYPTGSSAWHEFYSGWANDIYDPFHCNENGCQPEYPLSWFQAHHPDWIMYEADGKTPAVPLAGEGAGNRASLDTTNPDVQQWIIDRENRYLSAGYGYRGISYDHGVTWNQGHAVGHYDPSGKWVEQYSGDMYDPDYASAQADAFSKVVSGVKDEHPDASATINQGYTCKDPDWWASAVSADVVLDEDGFTNGGSGPQYATASKGSGCENQWLEEMQAYQRLQKDLGKGLVLVNQEPYQAKDHMTDSDPQAVRDIQWSLANYLLIKYDHTYFWWGGQSQYGQSYPQTEYDKASSIGAPEGDFYEDQNVYVRDYSGGLAVVNPSPDADLVIEEPEGEYKDLYGRTVTKYPMPPHSGAVFVKA